MLLVYVLVIQSFISYVGLTLKRFHITSAFAWGDVFALCCGETVFNCFSSLLTTGNDFVWLLRSCRRRCFWFILRLYSIYFLFFAFDPYHSQTVFFVRKTNRTPPQSLFSVGKTNPSPQSLFFVFALCFGYTVFNFFSSLFTPLKRFRVASSFVSEKMFLVYSQH